MSNPVFTWETHNAADFSDALECTYTEVVHWRKNAFQVPLGNAGKEFTRELARLYTAFGNASSMESIALKAATVLPILLLQKPNRTSKVKEHTDSLKKRLKTWKEGNLNDLVLEGRTIQRRLPEQHRPKTKDSLSRSFSNLMFAGKTKAALDLLTRNDGGGVLHLADPSNPSTPDSATVREVLDSKHPKGQAAHANLILPSDPPEIHPVIFDAINASTIQSAALRTTGSAGPSGLDAHSWRRMCTSFKSASIDLCNSLASVGRRMCTSFVDPKCTAPLLACRLIALDKKPGVRPIGIGDIARRIIAKAVLIVTRPDVQEASDCRQMCGGQISGIEAAVHAVRTAFESDDTEAVLLADASNSFNSLNRQTALQNI